MPDATDKLAEGYWEAYRLGIISHTGNDKDYPSWKASRAGVKKETARCLRVAVETLRHPTREMLRGQPNPELAREQWEAMFEVLFPGEPDKRRKIPLTDDDRNLPRQSHMTRRRL